MTKSLLVMKINNYIIVNYEKKRYFCITIRSYCELTAKHRKLSVVK